MCLSLKEVNYGASLIPLDRVAKELAKARGNETPNVDACSQLVTVLIFESYIAHSIFFF